MFASASPQRTEADDPGAPFFNDSPKYVVSSILTDPAWAPTTVLPAYGADVIRRLKDEVGGDVYVSGSATLALRSSQAYENGVVHFTYGPT